MSITIRGQVLLVDDEPMVRQTTAQWLELAGFEVFQFDHAAAALEVLHPEFAGILVICAQSACCGRMLSTLWCAASSLATAPSMT
ncbi:MAG: hypothetical protein V7629_05640 [Motiliproteus sp.]